MATAKKNDVKPKYFGEIQNAIANKKLIIVTGTGLSKALNKGDSSIFSWTGLIENGLEYCRARSCVSDSQYNSWKPHILSEDIDDLLSVAEFVGRKLGAPEGELYSRWLEQNFSDPQVMEGEFQSVFKSIVDLGIPIATLNYDTILEKITGLQSIKFAETKRVTEWVRREASGILHMHGVWNDPASCILGIRDYHATTVSDARQFIQRNLSTFGRLLFIGCGDTFSDPNFSALISWMRSEMKGASPLHYALVRENELSKRLADPNWKGFVEPISYGADHSDLPAYLRTIVPTLELTQYIRSSQPLSTEIQVRDDKTLSEYRTFLLRDCGQMTIEGIRTDIDTAQRKFDLEKLFVPLSVTPVPPEYPLSDKKRDIKLQKWLTENKEPTSFGEAFTKNQRIALLALPGGGKTLLLKRLAVAYADEERRNRADDSLPDLDIFPVLIRCREWREYIGRPISFILKNISNITGQTGLDNFYEALIPLLKAGKVILLVDGLDEIHNDADRATFAENLEKFLEEYKKVRLVITSREAGFGLIAPTIARYCSRWRLAPLSEETILSLCLHWHTLMTGDTPEAFEDANEVSRRLLSNPALKRLAENPLLLTMLLVVKHGAGRLPPDRVSLYSRAVEVLLDTWNIKGHEALSIKEALPQLSYIAYELMRLGKQTATQSELISLLEEAREKVPRIRLYAKDSPVDFLARVELRSSLLMEAGYQLEGAKAVPFYQFRHLTFQEYLAAEAAVDGNYREYSSEDNLLTPLAPYLSQEKWKEVIPMAAVLARKQAEPVILNLVSAGKILAEALRTGLEFDGKRDWLNRNLPAPVSMILQCLAEEVEASPQTLKEALHVLAVFAKGCRGNANWDVLLKGLYAEEFISVAFGIEQADWPDEIWIRNTKAVALALSQPTIFWKPKDDLDLIELQLSSSDDAVIERCLLSLAGAVWAGLLEIPPSTAASKLVEKHIFSRSAKIWEPAAWVFGLLTPRSSNISVSSSSTLDRFVEILFSGESRNEVGSFALGRCEGIVRGTWNPMLSEQAKKIVLEKLDQALYQKIDTQNELGYFLLAFHTPDLLNDRDLYERLKAMDRVAFPPALVGIVRELETSLSVPEEEWMSPRPKSSRMRSGGGKGKRA